jgi:hypothetical protein
MSPELSRPVQHGRCDGVEEIGGKVPAGGFTVDLGDQEGAGSLRSHTEDAPLDDHPQDSRRDQLSAGAAPASSPHEQREPRLLLRGESAREEKAARAAGRS